MHDQDQPLIPPTSIASAVTLRSPDRSFITMWSKKNVLNVSIKDPAIGSRSIYQK
jgi:hypothetical protein